MSNEWECFRQQPLNYNVRQTIQKLYGPVWTKVVERPTIKQTLTPLKSCSKNGSKSQGELPCYRFCFLWVDSLPIKLIRGGDISSLLNLSAEVVIANSKYFTQNFGLKWLEVGPQRRVRVTLSEECSIQIPNGNIRTNMNEDTVGRYGGDERRDGKNK